MSCRSKMRGVSDTSIVVKCECFLMIFKYFAVGCSFLVCLYAKWITGICWTASLLALFMCVGSQERLAEQEGRENSHLAQKMVCPHWRSALLLQNTTGSYINVQPVDTTNYSN